MDPTLDPYLWSLGQIESGGNYNAMGPTMDSGDRAYGKYQVMGSNIPQWTKIATGTQMTPKEFLADPDAQDAVASHYFGGYMKQYGNPYDAASMWFSGRPLATGYDKSDGYNTGAQYVNKFKSALAQYDPNLASSPVPQGSPATATQPTTYGSAGPMEAAMQGSGGGSEGMITAAPILRALGMATGTPMTNEPMNQMASQPAVPFGPGSTSNMTPVTPPQQPPMSQAMTPGQPAPTPTSVPQPTGANTPTSPVPFLAGSMALPGALGMNRPPPAPGGMGPTIGPGVSPSGGPVNAPAPAPQTAAGPQLPPGTQANPSLLQRFSDLMQGNTGGAFGNLDGLTQRLRESAAWALAANNPFGAGMMLNATSNSALNALKMREMMLPKFGVVGQDLLGHDIMGYSNPWTMQTYNQQGQPMNGAGAGAGMGAVTPSTLAAIQAEVAAGGDPDQVLQKYVGGYAPLIRDYANGQVNPQDISYAQRSGVQALARSAYNVSDAMIEDRMRFGEGYANMSPNGVGGQIAAGNRVVDHTNEAVGFMNDLDNSGVFSNAGAAFGGFANKAAMQRAILSGNQAVQAAYGGLIPTLSGIARETQKAQGNRPTEGETDKLVAQMDPMQVGPVAARKAIAANLKMLYGTLDGVAQDRNEGYKPSATDNEDAPHDPLTYKGRIRTMDLFGPAQRRILRSWGLKRDAGEDDVNPLWAKTQAKPTKSQAPVSLNDGLKQGWTISVGR
jgi:hypothetical protein